MADYKNIKGFNIQYLDSDPPNPIQGQMWFNSTSQTLKGAEAGGIAIGTWASGSSTNTARSSGFSGGTQTALLAATGSTSPAVESWNGTSWTEVAEANQPRVRGVQGGGGTSTSLIIAGGAFPGGPIAPLGITALSETWDGSSWTEGNDLNQGRGNGTMFGLSVPTACYATGFYSFPPVVTTNNFEQYNGTSWTNSTALSTSRIIGVATGSSTSGLVNSGSTEPYPTHTGATEIWNGSTWTTTTASNTKHLNGMGAGTSSTEVIIFGGEDAGSLTDTEYWNGTSWTELNNLANATTSAFPAQSGGTTATTSAAGVIGGVDSTTTEEWTVPEYVVKTFTTS